MTQQSQAVAAVSRECEEGWCTDETECDDVCSDELGDDILRERLEVVVCDGLCEVLGAGW